MKRRMAAIMAADVADYRQLLADDTEETGRRLASYREVFGDFVGRAGGRIFGTTDDAVLAEFPSAVDAIRAAIEIQESIRTRNLGYASSRHMRFRIGATIGDIIEREAEILGDAVSVAIRLAALAAPGSICVSRTVHEQVSSKLSVSFRDIGLQRVDNIAEAVHAFAIPVSEIDRAPRLSRVAAGITLLAVLALLAAAVVARQWLPALRDGGQQTASPATGPGSAPPAGTTPSVAVVPSRPRSWPPEDRIYGSKVTPPSDRSDALLVQPFDAARVPFVCESCRVRIANAMSAGPSKALAITQGGTFGVATDKATVEDARRDALDACFKKNGVGCDVYAVDDTVVWSKRPPPLPAPPWVDDTIERLPFDATRLAGLADNNIASIATGYAMVAPPKALALGPGGYFRYQSHGESRSDVIRRALERCGASASMPCRIVAVDDSFVVKPGPVVDPTPAEAAPTRPATAWTPP